MKAAKTTRRIIETLAQQYPNADTELCYRNAFELLVATIDLDNVKTAQTSLPWWRDRR